MNTKAIAEMKEEIVRLNSRMEAFMDLMSNKTGNMITGKSQSATGKNKEERNLTINIGNTKLSQQETQHRTKTSREGVNPETTEDHMDERYA